MSAIATLGKRLPRLSSVHVENVRVMLRTDFAGPWSQDLNSSKQLESPSASRFDAALPTLRNLIHRGARIILATGVEGTSAPESCISLAEKLAHSLQHEIRFPDELIGDGVSKLVNDTRAGQIVMLENLYFDGREKNNDPEFARYLANLCDVYVNDSLSICEHPFASTVGVPRKIGSRAMGLRLEHEVEGLLQICEAPSRPLTVMAGGPVCEAILSALQKQVEQMRAGDCVIMYGDLGDTALYIWKQHDDSTRIRRECVQNCKLLISKIQARNIQLVVCASASANDRNNDRSMQNTQHSVVELTHGVGDIPEFQDTIGWEHAFDRIPRSTTVLWLDNNIPESNHLPSGLQEQLVQQLTKFAQNIATWGSFAIHAMHTFAPQFAPCWQSMGDNATLRALADQPLPGLEALQQ